MTLIFNYQLTVFLVYFVENKKRKMIINKKENVQEIDYIHYLAAELKLFTYEPTKFKKKKKKYFLKSPPKMKYNLIMNIKIRNNSSKSW